MSLQFFIADDGSTGQELWVTNGTAPGTFRLRDINPGLGSANIGNLIQSNGIMYFTAYDGTSYHMWRSDGTIAGTYALTSSANGDNSGNLTNVNGRLFFTGSDSVHGSGLFVTDGTIGGTQFVSGVQNPSNFVTVGNSLFFVAYDAAHGYELWKSDGTAAGTAMVSDILPGSGYGSYGNFTALDGKLYFTTSDGVHGTEVWVSDGTTAGTFQLKDINLGANGSSAGNFFAANGHVFFTANDGAHGTQYWSTDGTSAGTSVLTLSTGQSPTPLGGTQIVFNHNYYYVGSDPAGGRAIFTSDGTTLTKQVHLSSFSGKFYNLGAQLMFFGNDGTHGSGLYTFNGTAVTFVSSVPGGFSQPVVGNGHLFFVSYDVAHGYELWVTDGTAAGTHITADINPGAYDAQITNISAVGTGVVFTAYRPDVGTELFFSDGTAAGTGLLSNVNPTGDHSPSLGFGSAVVQAGGVGFFSASDGTHGYELWVTDGTATGSHMVVDQVFGSNGAGPQGLTAAGGRIFFTADDGVNGRQVYTSDGNSVTQLTSNGVDTPYNDAGRFFTLGGKFYFMAYDPAGGFNLMRSDGTLAGTQVAAHISYDIPLHVGDHMVLRGDDGTHGYGLYGFDGTTLSFIANPGSYDYVTVSGNKVFWRGYDSTNGYELWASDGTAAGTHLVKDVNPGPYDSGIANIISLNNGSVVFTANNPSTGNELYVSDGTAAGTMLLSDVNATGNHGQSLNFYSDLYAVGGLTFFAGEDGIHGSELWVTDGTTGNTHMVTDMIVGGGSSSPQSFFVAGGHIFFTADDGVNGRQIYTSDGTSVTRLTSNGLDTPYNDAGRFFTLGGKFYFMAYNPAGGWNLVGSDGTVAGTQVVGSLGYDTPLQVGDHLVMHGDDGVHGAGLYRFDGTTIGFIATTSTLDGVTVSGNNIFWRSYDAAYGYELWSSDGTAAGTHRVKDINPGPYDSTPQNIVGLNNGSVVFTAFNPATGNEVYVSDGTAAGTMLLSDVNATGNHGQSLNFNSGLYNVGGLTFFAGEDGIHGNELWVTDGTTGNSHIVTDLVVGGNSSSPQSFYVAASHIFFTADDGVNGRQLYTSDGSSVTRLTSNNLDTPYNDAGRFFVMSGKLFFMAYDATGGWALFGSDGTLAGTTKISHFGYDTPIKLGDVMILRGNDDVHGQGLYSFDGTNPPTLLANGNYFENPTVSGGNVFYRGADGGDGYELWVTNGTAAGTHEVKDINPGGSWSYPNQITSLGNGSVVFTADDGTHGSEIWVSNGTAAGTTMLADLFPDATGSNPDRLTKVGGQVFFTANYFSPVDGAHGTELFVTDGTTAGTHIVRDINSGSDGTSFSAFYSFGGKLYFSAYFNGWHLYVTDGTDAGTHIVTPGDGSSTGPAGNFIAADATHFYFTGDSGLFYSDGTDAGTVNIGSSRGFDANVATVTGGQLLYRLYDDTNGYELWTTNGSAAGTHRVTDTLIPNSSNATGFVFSGGKVYFYADDGVHGGNELFVTDGTTAGTHLLNDFNGTGGTPYGANFAFGGKFYFVAYDGNDGGWHTYVTSGTTVTKITPGDGSSTGPAGNFLAADATHFYFTGDSGLFYSDGTSTGTVNIGSGRGFDPATSTVTNGQLLYRLYDDTNGYELWTTNGSAAGTHRVTDTLIPNSSNATGFVFSGGKVYFYADDGIHGANELFVSDGTAAGTHLLNDFNGAGGTPYGSNFAFGGKFFFTAYDYSGGGWHTYVTSGTTVTQITPSDGSSTGPAGNFLAADATHFFFTGDSGLFYSDGTNAGTHLISDARGFGNASVVNGHLYFQHYDDTNGYELWTSDGTAAGTMRLTDTLIPNSSNPGSFAAIDNSPPTVANAAASAITDQQTFKAFENVVIGDTDAPAQTLTVTITPDDPAKGRFTAASLTASGFVGGGVGGSYTFQGTAAQATAAIDALIYQPTANRLVVGASETINYTIAVNDGAGGSVVNHLTAITQTSANDAPTGVGDTAAVDEDATIAATTRSGGVLGNDSDADVGETPGIHVTGAHFGTAADTAVLASGTSVIHGTYGDLSIAADGTYSYTPNTPAAEALAQGSTASEAFSYTVTDVHGASSTAMLTFTITGREDGPVAVADVLATFEDVASSAASRSVGLLGNDTDVDAGEAATLRISGAHFGTAVDTTVAATGTTTIHGTYGDLLLAADGTYTYTPNSAAAEALTQGQAASDQFSYTIVDVQGQSATSTVRFNVTGTNDAPVAIGESVSLNEDATVGAATRAAGLLGNDTDVDSGETATLRITGAHAGNAADSVVAATGTTVIHGTFGDLSIAADGTYSYTANSAAAEALPLGQTASDVFSYTVADVNNGTGTATLTFAITGQNDAPTASIASGLNATEQVTLDLKGSIQVGDIDSGNPIGTVTLSVGYGLLHLAAGTSGVTITANDAATVIVSGTTAQLGALFGSDATSVVSYIADTDTPPTSVTLNLSVTDDHNATGSASRTIVVTPVDDAAVAVNDSNTVAANAALTGVSVFGNDYDVDGPALQVGAVNGSPGNVGTQFALPSGALLTLAANGTYSYNPNHAFDYLTASTGAVNSSGTDAFTYTLVNGNTATVTIAITADPNSTQPAIGSSGADTITGTSRDDVIDLRQGGSDVAHGAGGNDTFYMGAAWDAGDRLDGGAGALDQIVAQGNTTLTLGAAGVTGIEQITLLTGSDTSYGDVFGLPYSYAITSNDANVLAGQQLVVQGGSLHANESLTFNGSAELDGSFLMYGGLGNDVLTGGRQADTLYGGGGDDWLDGGIGADTMAGGAGNDTYIVDDAGDMVIEQAGKGTADVVRTGLASYVLAANVENLIGTANTGQTLTGNDAANTITGGSGNDVIDGGLGADTMIGGAGNDSYVVDNAGDMIFESANGGTDTIFSSINFSLADTPNVENLTLTGTADLEAYGNAGDNVLTGNAGNNYLSGGAGADTMIGGAGDDIYVVDNVNDVVVENAGEGTDIIKSQVTYSIANNLYIESLRLVGSANIDATGNIYRNKLVGNDGDNVLDGGGGGDVLRGGLGNDTFIVRDAADRIVEFDGYGTDTVRAAVSYTLTSDAYVEALRTIDASATTAINLTGNDHTLTIEGNAGANVLTGGAGNETLTGFGGSDTFVFAAGNGQDTVSDFTSGSDKLDLSAYFTSFAQVQAASHDVGGTAVIDFGGGNGVTLSGVLSSQLQSGDVILGSAGSSQPTGATLIDNIDDLHRMPHETFVLNQWIHGPTDFTLL